MHRPLYRTRKEATGENRTDLLDFYENAKNLKRERFLNMFIHPALARATPPSALRLEQCESGQKPQPTFVYQAPTPPGAAVRMDGRSWGIPPMRICGLRAGGLPHLWERCRVRPRHGRASASPRLPPEGSTCVYVLFTPDVLTGFGIVALDDRVKRKSSGALSGGPRLLRAWVPCICVS